MNMASRNSITYPGTKTPSATVDTWPAVAHLATTSGGLTMDLQTRFANTTAAIEHLGTESRRLASVRQRIKDATEEITASDPLNQPFSTQWAQGVSAQYDQWTRDCLRLYESWHEFKARTLAQCIDMGATGFDTAEVRRQVSQRAELLGRIREEHAPLFGSERLEPLSFSFECDTDSLAGTSGQIPRARRCEAASRQRTRVPSSRPQGVQKRTALPVRRTQV